MYRATSILKTWAYAWATSRRMHEDAVHPCLFVSGGFRDDQLHYLQCDRLWQHVLRADRALSLASAARNGSVNTEVEIAVKLLFVNPTEATARGIVTMFLAYNSVKHGHLHKALALADDPALAGFLQSIVDAAFQQAMSTSKSTCPTTSTETWRAR